MMHYVIKYMKHTLSVPVSTEMKYPDDSQAVNQQQNNKKQLTNCVHHPQYQQVT